MLLPPRIHHIRPLHVENTRYSKDCFRKQENDHVAALRYQHYNCDHGYCIISRWVSKPLCLGARIEVDHLFHQAQAGIRGLDGTCCVCSKQGVLKLVDWVKLRAHRIYGRTSKPEKAKGAVHKYAGSDSSWNLAFSFQRSDKTSETTLSTPKLRSEPRQNRKRGWWAWYGSHGW